MDRAAGPNPLEQLGVSEPVDPPYSSHPRIHSEVSGTEEMVGRTICVKRLRSGIFGEMTNGPRWRTSRTMF